LSVYRASVANPQKVLDYKAALAAGDVMPGIVKLSGARTHMDTAMVTQIYAAFDAGQTIDEIVAWSKFSTRAIAARRQSWKKARVGQTAS
jgi:hypothetical protein